MIRTGTFQFVPAADIHRFLQLGWMVLRDLGRVHGTYSVLMWRCDCRAPNSNAHPPFRPTAQDAGVARARRDQGLDEAPGGDGLKRTRANPVHVVTHAATGEGVRAPVDPVSAGGRQLQGAS